MLYKFILMFLFSLVLVKHTTGQSQKINLMLSYQTVGSTTQVTCDHGLEDVHKYTALEGQNLTINLQVNIDPYIHRLRCTRHNDASIVFLENMPSMNVHTTLNVRREMGAIWDCEIWIYEDVRRIGPNVDGHTYTAPHCYLRIHVRRIEAPQTILVNNVISQPVRTDLSEQHVDFRLEYEYADNDMVDITCSNYNYDALGTAELSLEHSTLATAEQIMLTDTKRLSSPASVGVRVRLHSRHNRASITCNYTENDDFTNIQVVFIMRTNFDCAVSVSIDGLNLRPKAQGNNIFLIFSYLHKDYCVIDYNFISHKEINMLCEVKRADLNLVVSPENYFRRNESMRNLAEATFVLNQDKVEVSCSAKCNAELEGVTTAIKFIPFDKVMTDNCPLHVELPQNNIVKELHEWRNSSRIYYEYEEGDNVTVTCYTTCKISPVRMVMKIDDTVQEHQRKLSRTLSLSNQALNTGLKCYLYTETNHYGDNTLREVTVIFVNRARSIGTNNTEAPKTYFTITTEDKLEYHFFPVSSGSLQFKVKTRNDAHIALTMEPQESDPMIELFLGGWRNTKSAIRYNKTKPNKVEIETPNILNGSEFRGFWVRWDGGVISAGREGEAIPFISWVDPKPFPITFVGVSTGWGATGTWMIEVNKSHSVNLIAVLGTAVLIFIAVIIVVIVVCLRRCYRRPETPFPEIVPTTNYYENMLPTVRQLVENDHDREDNYEVIVR